MCELAHWTATLPWVTGRTSLSSVTLLSSKTRCTRSTVTARWALQEWKKRYRHKEIQRQDEEEFCRIKSHPPHHSLVNAINQGRQSRSGRPSGCRTNVCAAVTFFNGQN